MAAMDTVTSLDIPFPAPTKSSSGIVGPHATLVTSIEFADKILITISQAGKLSHWVHVPLLSSSAAELLLGGSSEIPLSGDEDSAEHSLLPLSHLTATTVFGGTKRDEEILGQTLATTIATAILMKAPREQRTLVMGLGLELAAAGDADRGAFDQAVGLVMEVL